MAYNLTREQAADILKISTRTLDRWIRSGKLSHSKESNKVMLSEGELRNFNKSWGQTEVLIQWKSKSKSKSKSQIAKIQTNEMFDQFSKKFDQQTVKFIEILNAKDLKIEHKNQVIMSLQQRVFEAESKLKHSIALPLHKEKNQETLRQKEILEFENDILESEINSVKIKNIALIWALIVCIIILIVMASW